MKSQKNEDSYEILISELNETGYNNKPAILLYYSPALLSNAYNYFKKNNYTSLMEKTLEYCLPFMQNILNEVRIKMNSNKNGVVTVMLREAALIASKDPFELVDLKVSQVSEIEAIVKK